MAQIPSVPTIEAVDRPMMKPSEAGRPGMALAGAGEDVQQMANSSYQLDVHIREAQKQVDELTAKNELNAAAEAYQIELSKTQNSRDIEGVKDQARKTLAEITKKWADSGSPAAIEIGMQAQALGPYADHLGTVRQIDLLGKEGKIQLDQAAETLAAPYASARAANDPTAEQAAISGFTQMVNGMVKTGLMGDVEARAKIKSFRGYGQELQIKNAISNPNPEVNQAIYDKINSEGQKAFPDVTPEALDLAKEHALSAVESHIKHQQWAEGQMAQNTMLRPLIDAHTNPATKQFDEQKALSDTAEQFRTGKINVHQMDALQEGIKAYGADVNGEQKKKFGIMQDEIEKDFHDKKFAQGFDKLEKARPWMEQNGFSEHYKSIMNYGDSQQRELRQEYKQDEYITHEKDKEKSQEITVGILADIGSGKIPDPLNVKTMLGLTPGDRAQILGSITLAKSRPDFVAATNLISNTFSVSKGSTPKDTARLQEMSVQTNAMFMQEVNERPGVPKMQIAQELLKPAVQKMISERIMKQFQLEEAQSMESKVFGYFHKATNQESGLLHVRDKATGKTGTIESSEYDESKYEKVK